MYFKRFFVHLFVLFMAFSLVLFSGCNSKKRSDEVSKYAYKGGSGESAPDSAFQVRFPALNWVESGTVCYGLVVGIDGNGRMVTGLPIKARVVSFKPDSIKMKALETVSLVEVKGCTKMGLSKGDIWWETEGDLFKTREEAVAWLKERGLLQGEEGTPEPVTKS